MRGRLVGVMRRWSPTTLAESAAWAGQLVERAIASNVCVYGLALVMTAARAWHFYLLRDFSDPVAILLDLGGVSGLVISLARTARDFQQARASRRSPARRSGPH